VIKVKRKIRRKKKKIIEKQRSRMFRKTNIRYLTAKALEDDPRNVKCTYDTIRKRRFTEERGLFGRQQTHISSRLIKKGKLDCVRRKSERRHQAMRI